MRRPLRAKTLHVLCPLPVNHVLEFARLYHLAGQLRAFQPELELVAWVRTDVEDFAAFEQLPYDAVHRWQSISYRAREEGRLPVQLLKLAAAESRRTPCLLANSTKAWRSTVRQQDGLRLVGSLPQGFAGELFDGPLGAAAVAFQGAVTSEAPRWVMSANALWPVSLKPEAHVLIHQARHHVGDALWLTPLLRGLFARHPQIHATVLVPKEVVPLIATGPWDAVVLPYDPGNDRHGDRLLDVLYPRRPDAAIFAFGRSAESRPLVQLMANMGVEYRINLEYFDALLDHNVLGGWMTHEAFSFWAGQPSPLMLCNALLALPGSQPAEAPPPDRRLEVYLPSGARQRAAQRLADRGLGEEPFAVLAPGGRSSRCWPPERFAELAVKLAEEWGLHVLVEGAPDEARLLAHVRRLAAAARPPGAGAKSGREPRRIVAAADPLEVFAAVLERARLLVANDSAPIHLAEAANLPTLYFAQQEKLVHSHPAGDRSWALFEDVTNDPARITVGQAWGALEAMRSEAVIQL